MLQPLLLLLLLPPRLQSKLVTNLGWSANSMTCRAGFIAAGGLHGEVRAAACRTAIAQRRTW
jgi:hypothetical protein